ncbi:MAG: PAS domain S-box protein [Rhodocyclaceae bacterium]|jgi:PAS domain S-box-containing protein|nr:MAG: PAS domain S-box protein [Rhodocyclaceae bacterium]
MSIPAIGQSDAALNSDFIALVIFKDRHVAWANAAAHRLFGYAPDALVGQPVSLFFPDQASYESFRREVLAALAENQPYRGTVPQMRKDGSTGWFEFNISRHAADEGMEIAAIVDRTASHHLADQLQASELRYRSVVEDQTEVICRLLPDNTFVFVNEVYCRFFGKTFAELIGNRWHPLAHPDDLPMIERKLQEMRPDNPVVTIENRVYRADGELRWMQFVNRGFFNAEGRLEEIQCVGRDISTIKQFEDDLRQSEERYRALVETTSAVTWHCPPSGMNVAPQPSWMAFTGQSAEEMLSAGWSKAVHPEDQATVVTLWNTAVERNEPFYNEYRIRRLDGEWRWMRVRAVPVRNQQGQTVEWMGMGQDITEQKQAELALKEHQDRLELALAGSAMACWDWDIQKHEVTGDERWPAMLGYLPGELVLDEAQWLALIDPRDRSEFDRTMAAYLAGDTSHYQSEHRLRYKDGHWVAVEARGKVTRRDERGAPQRMVGTVLDITQRKRLNEEGLALLKQIETLIRKNEVNPPAVPADRSPLTSLTKREQQILVMIAEGMTSAQIGLQLQLSTNTIVSHRKNLMAKLKLHTTAQVTRFAMDHGLLTPKH